MNHTFDVVQLFAKDSEIKVLDLSAEYWLKRAHTFQSDTKNFG